MSKLAEPAARKAARKIIKRRWRQLAQRARQLRQRRDHARLHDFRVALRRMRATLALCDQQLGLATRKAKRRAIKELAAASGALRDWEIVRTQLAELWPADPAKPSMCPLTVGLLRREVTQGGLVPEAQVYQFYGEVIVGQAAVVDWTP